MSGLFTDPIYMTTFEFIEVAHFIMVLIST